MKKIYGFSLIELMVVISIVVLLSAVAVPAYKNYVTKARIASVLPNIFEVIKKKTLEYYNTKGQFPNSWADMGISANSQLGSTAFDNSFIQGLILCHDPSATYTTGCTGAGATYDGQFGFVIYMNPAQLPALPSSVTSPVILGTAEVVNDSIIWYCTTDAGGAAAIPANLLPGGCVRS